MPTVLITDYAWPDTRIEADLLHNAGLKMVTGPSTAGSPQDIEALVRRHQPEAIMTCWAPVSTAAIESAPNLKIVARLGVGLDNIDVATATARRAWVTNVPDYCVEEVSDHALGMLLAWARGIVAFDRSVKDGQWAPATAQLRRVQDLTIGILGFGRIGRRTAEKLVPWRARIHSHTIPEPTAIDLPVEFVSLDQLLSESDAVIIHLPLLPSTHHLLNDQRLRQMNPGAFLINVSRGGIIDTPALLRVLEEGRLSGAALDVVEGEPSPPLTLIHRRDVICTPHVAFSSASSLIELRRRATEEVVRVLRGESPLHPCNTIGAHS